MRITSIAPLLLSLALGACFAGSDSTSPTPVEAPSQPEMPEQPAPPPDDPAPPPDDPPPPPAHWLAGEYAARGTWDLTSAITEHPGIGTVVADLIVEEVVSATGVPGPLEEMAREQVAALIRDPIRDYVDARVPTPVAPDSAMLDDLAAVLGEVEVASTLRIEEGGGDDFEGEEIIVSVRLHHGDRSLLIPAEEILSGGLDEELVDLGAALEATLVDDRALALSPHEFALRFDALVVRAATELLEVADAEALGDQVAEQLDCAQMIDEITAGQPEFTFSVGGQGFSVGVERLLEGCEMIRAEVADYALGFFRKELGVATGGSVRIIGPTEPAGDADEDAAMACALASSEDYRGQITAVPLPTPTHFAMAFTATREREPGLSYPGCP